MLLVTAVMIVATIVHLETIDNQGEGNIARRDYIVHVEITSCTCSEYCTRAKRVSQMQIYT